MMLKNSKKPNIITDLIYNSSINSPFKNELQKFIVIIMNLLKIRLHFMTIWN